MALNFAELTTAMRAGKQATDQDVHDVLTASPAATFALVEFAAEYRRTFFKNTVEVSNLMGAENLAQPPAALLEVTAPLDAEALTAQIVDLAGDDDIQRITVDFVQGEKNLIPMEALRVLAAVRLAAPVKSLRLGATRETVLKSLQPLALHMVDALYLHEYPAAEPRLIFEDLKLLRDAGLTVDGAEGRDLPADYAADLVGRGVEDAPELARLILDGTGAPTGGGCGGNCACGSGGCG